MTTTNRLLAMLPPTDLQHILSQLEDVSLLQGAVVHEPGVRVHHMLFPITAVFSIVHDTIEGDSAEVVMTGNEGAIGIGLVLSDDLSQTKAVVHTAGTAKRIGVAALKQVLADCPSLLMVLLRYTQTLIDHMAQIFICAMHHSVDQQVCRYLLLSADRANSMELRLTHAYIAGMLGVRREGVSVAAEKLQEAGIIQYARGKIMVINRGALRDRTCECYDVINQQYTCLYEREQMVRVGNG